ncbi:hypothetical protein CLOBOL_01358 [Enterocloster bolteae ATCC BAA-613]|uniref:Uncharacterized protein n=1 Tax=Enterocloster bolteae (strain ATCC BAA-613 / DSM 15670 / CCUG 46953 / JCM 12243 / WAL 16351) TaxID=411902 RepID=A8RKL4_ENTBW|nr:hypothetical protein CLOBOL_01358 [Enterocloster bolteae ATCC BAA-613]
MLIRLFFIILGQWDISHWLLPFSGPIHDMAHELYVFYHIFL